MSKYTTEVRFICENYAGYDESQSYQSVDDIVETAAPLIFEEFPIFDENYRLLLEKKILRHYYTREIGYETVGLWKLKLNDAMNEIMPYYNQFYRSELLEFNPFWDVDYTNEHTKNENTNGEENKIRNKTESVSDIENKNGSNNRNESRDSSNIEMKNETDSEATQNKHNISAEGVEIKNENSDEKSNVTGNVQSDNITERNRNSNETVTADNDNKFSDTPQGQLSLVKAGTYLTNYTNTTEDRHSDVSENNNEINTNAQKTDSEQNNEGNNNTSKIETNNTKDETEIDGANNSATNRIENNTEKNVNDDAYNENRNAIRSTDGETKSKNTNTITTTSAYLEHISGKRNDVSYSDLLNKYRNTFMNIDMMVIDALADLFMKIY